MVFGVIISSEKKGCQITWVVWFCKWLLISVSLQGSSHSYKATLHQCVDRVWPVTSLCVDMERIHRCQGESMLQCLQHLCHHFLLMPEVWTYLFDNIHSVKLWYSHCMSNLTFHLFLCLYQTGPSLLALMGMRFEGLIPAIILPLLLTMVRSQSMMIVWCWSIDSIKMSFFWN